MDVRVLRKSCVSDVVEQPYVAILHDGVSHGSATLVIVVHLDHTFEVAVIEHARLLRDGAGKS